MKTFQILKEGMSMKKLRVMLMITIISMSFMMYGCEKEEKSVQEQEKAQAEEDKEEPVQEEKEVEVEKEEEIVEEKNEAVAVAVANMKIYYVDLDTGEIVSKDIETDDVTPEVVWEQLKKEGVIKEECGLNSFSFNDTEKTMDMDVDEAFGNYIRSMGTTGEDILITCITRSYLETYGYEGIKITEDNKVLETGHAVLDGYIGLE